MGPPLDRPRREEVYLEKPKRLSNFVLRGAW